MGAKKHDRAILACTVDSCDSDFYVSMATTPAKRYCAEHYGKKGAGTVSKGDTAVAEMIALIKGEA